MALTEKQKAFCRNIVSGMTNKEAYQAAYNCDSDNAAWIESTKLLKRDDIAEEIKTLRKPIELKAQTDALTERERKRSILWGFITNPAVADNDKLRAMDLLNKMDAEYININHNIEDKKTDISHIDLDKLKQLAGV